MMVDRMTVIIMHSCAGVLMTLSVLFLIIESSCDECRYSPLRISSAVAEVIARQEAKRHGGKILTVSKIHDECKTNYHYAVKIGKQVRKLVVSATGGQLKWKD